MNSTTLKALTAALLFISACSGPLPHEAPFDPKAPVEKQAKAKFSGSVALKNESDNAGVNVRLENVARNYSFETANDGTFRILNLVPGVYSVTFSTRYFTAVTQSVTLAPGESVALPGNVVLNPATARIFGNARSKKLVGGTSEVKGGVTLKFTRKRSIRGVGTAPEFMAMAGAGAGVTAATTYVSVSSADGSYSIDGVEAGIYTVSASDDAAGVSTSGEDITVTGDSAVAVPDLVVEPLTGLFSIAGLGATGTSASYTRDAVVTLTLLGFNAQKMKIGRSGSGLAAACLYDAPITYDISFSYRIENEGAETICVKFIDKNGVETADLLESIVYDMTPPMLSSLSINDGAPATASLQVGLRLSAIDAASDVYGYQVSTPAASWSQVYTFQNSAVFLLPAGDGSQTVWVRYEDGAGNFANPVSASIAVAIAPPVVGPVTLQDDTGNVIDPGATTRSARVFVNSSVTSTSLLEIQVTATGNYSGLAWEPYSSLKGVDLPAPTSSTPVGRAVSARVRDQVGRQLELLSAFAFFVDTRAPVGTVSAPSLVSSTTLPLALTTNEPGSTTVEISEDASFAAAASLPFQSTLNYTLINTSEGVHILYVRFLDAVGNKSETQTVAVSLDRAAPLVASFVVEEGAITNLQTIHLHFVAIDAVKITVSENICSANWIDYSPDYPWTFTNTVDGTKQLRVRFQDAAGNATACLSAAIAYDQTPPSVPTLTFSGATSFATERNITLLIGAPGATQMQLSESLGFGGSAWQPVTSTVNWTLSASDGPKTLYIQVRDDANNFRGPSSMMLTLDTLGPEQPIVTVNTGTGYAQAVTVTLHLSATGAPTRFRWSVDGVIDNKAWQAMTAATSATLNSVDGPQTVLAQFQDAAGNNSLAASAQVNLDRSAPSSPLLRIDDGSLYSRNSQGTVTLTLNAADSGSGLLNVKLAGSSAALATAPTLPFEPTKLFTLFAPGNDGIKDVWATFIDRAGNFSVPVSSTIVLDRTLPTAILSILGGSLTTSNMLTVLADADADVSLMLLSNDPSFTGAAWQNFASSFLWIFPAVQGPVNLYAQFKDAAGNVSGVITLPINIDSVPPIVGGISGSVLSDTLVWDHFAPDVTSYSVMLYNGSQIASVTQTTAKQLQVGTVSPNFTIIANYQDGTRSWPSFSPGYFVPVTPQALLAFNMDAGSNQLAARILNTAYPGATATSALCGAQVVLNSSGDMMNAAGGMNSSVNCGLASQLSMASGGGNYWQGTPPPFTGGIVSGAGNPLTGLTVNVTAGSPGYGYGDGYESFVTVPNDAQWPGLPYPQIYRDQVVIQGKRFNPVTLAGQNSIQSLVSLGALAMGDDATYSVMPFSGTLTSELPLAPQTISLTGQMAGMAVTQVTLANGWWGNGLFLNSTSGLDAVNNNYYSGIHPATILLPRGSNGSIVGNTIVTSSGFDNYYCWYCGTTRVVTDFYSGDITYQNQNYYSSGFYQNDNISVNNADGSRTYRVPVYQNAEGAFHWSTEFDQPTFPPVLKRLIHTLAIPTRVRGTGNPRLTSNVPDAVNMQVSFDSSFTAAVWQPYATQVTLAAGTTVVWVRYSDQAGNVTGSQVVTIVAPTLAPRLDSVGIAGPNASAGFTTVRDVVATVKGEYPANTRVRFSTAATFANDSWQPLINNQIAINLENRTGHHYYYFWLADASNNFSLPISSSVLYDGTPPQAEFSVMSDGVGQIRVQMMWTVSRSAYQPSLTDVTPIGVGDLTLPFEFPFNGVTSSSIALENGLDCSPQVGCIQIKAPSYGSLVNIRAFKEIPDLRERLAKITPQQAVFVWKGFDYFGTAITVAVTLRPSGAVSLSYWNTGAKFDMQADVGSVPSPYSDWKYELPQGSVDYSPNPRNIKLTLRSQRGTVVNVASSDIYCYTGMTCNPWVYRPVTDTGKTTFIGTAYSLAGAAGKVTVREIVLPAVNEEGPSNALAVPISDARFWTTWDHPVKTTTQAFLLENGEMVGADTILSGSPNLTSGFRTAWSLSSYNNTPYYRLPYSQQIKTNKTIASSGALVSIDESNNLLYGADGSIWDATDPGALVPIRIFGGNFPEPKATVARWKDRLWTSSGVYNIANPEYPSFVSQDPGPSFYHVAYRGRIYEIVSGALKIYDAGTFLPLGSHTGYYYTGPMMIQGSRLFVGANVNLVEMDLTNPDVPVALPAIGGASWISWISHEAGVFNTSYYPMAAAGFLRYASTGNLFASYFGNAQVSESLPLQATGFSAAGPWLFASTQGGLSVRHAGSSLPGKTLQTTVAASGTLVVGGDSHYYYVCNGGGLSWYSHDWALLGTLNQETCNSLEDSISSSYPFIYLNNIQNWGRTSRRFVFENGVLNRANLTIQVPMMPGPGYNSADLAIMDAAYTPSAMGSGDAFWPTADRAVAFSDANCQPFGTDGDRVYCVNQNDNAVYGTTLTANMYSGIVTGPLTLPLVHLFNPPYIHGLHARDGFIALGNGMSSGVYALNDLRHPTLVSTQLVRLLPGNLATKGNGDLYKVSESGVTPVGRISGVNGGLVVAPNGFLLAPGSSGDRVISTQWGPGVPELRARLTSVAPASAMVQAGGYVYMAGGAAGLIRLDALSNVGSVGNQPGTFVRHVGNDWKLFDAAMNPITSTSTDGSVPLATLCGDWMDRKGVAVCSSGSSTPDGNLFQGDLGTTWLASPGMVTDITRGGSTQAVADEQGTVYTDSIDFPGYVFMYSSGLAALGYSDSYFVGYTVSQFAVDHGRLLVSDGATIEARDLASPGYGTQLWSNPTGLPVQKLRAAGDFVVFSDTGYLHTLDGETGVELKSCYQPSQDFTLVMQRWGGQTHPVAISANGSAVQFISLLDCLSITNWYPSLFGSNITAIDYQNGILKMGLGAEGMALASLANFPNEGMITYLNGPEPIDRAVIQGEFVYTSGSGGAQIFQLH